jgi:hypothetical protein
MHRRTTSASGRNSVRLFKMIAAELVASARLHMQMNN